MEKRSAAGYSTFNMVLHAKKMTTRKIITIRPASAKELTEGKEKE